MFERNSFLSQLQSLEDGIAERWRFGGRGPQQLWTWQQERTQELREAMRLRLPAVYAPPRFDGPPAQPGSVATARGLLETEKDVCLPFGLVVPPDEPSRAVLVLGSDVAGQDALTQELTERGIMVALLTMRADAAATELSASDLAAQYLRVGRSYLGAAVMDIVRAVDFLESHTRYPVEIAGLAAAGHDCDAAAAAMAVDRRIRGLVLNLGDRRASSPSSPPLLVGAGSLEPVWLALSCCAPRPLMMVGQHTSWRPKLSLANLYRHSGHEGRLHVGTPDTFPVHRRAEFLLRCLT